MNLPNFTKLPRAIAIDLDGTLLNSKTQLSERNSLALEKCIARGIPVIIATNRPERAVLRFFGKNLADVCSLIVMNGGMTKGRTPLTGLICETIPSDIAGKIVQLVNKSEPAARITVEIDGFIFGSNIERSPEELWRTNSATPDMVCTLQEALVRMPAKIAVNGLGKDLSSLAMEITKCYGASIAVIPSDNHTFLNILNNKTSKSKALRKLLEPNGIAMEETLAFGDDLPDLDMLRCCGISVAMANSIPEIKSAAKYETASNDEDGVAVVLEKMLKSGDFSTQPSDLTTLR
jgi:Cof subfamily protein (haloacid dehalogenase superfamily)